jgi:predicted enzyme related to lactoylglutathione lyase
MKSTENALNWFEIAVTDFSRAKKFYETVFDMEMIQKVTGWGCTALSDCWDFRNQVNSMNKFRI